MLTPPAGLKVFVATKPVDFRKDVNRHKVSAASVRLSHCFILCLRGHSGAAIHT
jgi:hypothetical protein